MDVKELRLKYSLSQQDLSEKTGIPKGRINNWEQGRGKPKAEDKEVLEHVFEQYEINVPRFKIQKGGGTHEIPFYDAVAVGGMSMLADQSPLSQPTEMINPGSFLKAATGALRVYGHSMYPKYPAGCIVAFKESSMPIPSVILFGEDYVIELEERRVIKNVARGKSSEFINIISLNDGNGEKLNQDIPIKDIKRMYMVLGKIELEASL